MAWSTVRKVAFILTIINFFLNPLLIYFSPWGSSVDIGLRVFGCLCSMLPHAIGFFGCLFKVPCLLITYIVLTIISIVMWTVGFLVEIWLGVSNYTEEGIKGQHEFTIMKWNKTRPDEYYKSYGLKCLIGGGLGIVYCVFQVVLLCFYFKARKEIRTEQQREMYNAMGYPHVRQDNTRQETTRPEPVPSSSVRPSMVSETE